MLRKLLRKLSRGRVLRRQLPVRFGSATIYVTPEAALSHWKRDVEAAFPEIFRWVDATVRPGDVVWDIGANVGLFAMTAAQAAGGQGQVVAFEPDLFLAGLLNKSASRPTRGAAVSVLPVAISRGLTVSRLNIAEGGRCANYLDSAAGSKMALDIRRSMPTITLSLDQLLESLPAPAVIKIDVEGAELDVLEGARKVLKTYHPVLLCEVSKLNSIAVKRLLAEFDYHLFDLDTLPFQAIESTAGNTLCLPDDRLDEFCDYIDPSTSQQRAA